MKYMLKNQWWICFFSFLIIKENYLVYTCAPLLTVLHPKLPQAQWSFPLLSSERLSSSCTNLSLSPESWFHWQRGRKRAFDWRPCRGARVGTEGGHPVWSLSQSPACPEQPSLINPLTGAPDGEEKSAAPHIKVTGSISPLSGHQIKMDAQAETYPPIKEPVMHRQAH